MLGCVGLLLALTACQAGTGNSADSNKAAEQKLQLVLKRLFRQWNTHSGDTTSTLVMNQVYEGLYVLGKEDELELGSLPKNQRFLKMKPFIHLRLEKMPNGRMMIQ